MKAIQLGLDFTMEKVDAIIKLVLDLIMYMEIMIFVCLAFVSIVQNHCPTDGLDPLTVSRIGLDKHHSIP